MRRVYRVEHLTMEYDDLEGIHEGPYSAIQVGALLDMKAAHAWCPHHPGIRDDIVWHASTGWHIPPYMVCGFASLEQLCEWFDGWLKALGEASYAIAVYDAEVVRDAISRKQLAFDTTTATLVSRERIDESSLLGFGNDRSQGNYGTDPLLLVR